METTCRLVYPSRGIEDEAVWSPHAASFSLLPAALKTRRCGVHTLPRFLSFLGHRRRGGVEPTCRLVSPLFWGIEDEAVWSPHAASFPLFFWGIEDEAVWSRLISLLHRVIEDEAVWSPHAASFPFFTAASRTRRRGAHTPPRFPSSPWHRRQGGMKPTRRLVSFPSRSVNLVSAPFTFFCLYLELPSFH